jgi:hypothetical protein
MHIVLLTSHSSRTNNSWLFAPSSLILANNYLPLNGALYIQGWFVKYSLCIVFILFLSGCTASYHNLNNSSNSLGGGFADNKVHDGLYSIVAKTNFAPWTDFKAANKIFRRRATELCKSENFISIKVVESEYEHIPMSRPPKYIISQVNGYVICKSSNLTIEEAEKLIQLSYIVNV